jgi:hypothetical protein
VRDLPAPACRSASSSRPPPIPAGSPHYRSRSPRATGRAGTAGCRPSAWPRPRGHATEAGFAQWPAVRDAVRPGVRSASDRSGPPPPPPPASNPYPRLDVRRKEPGPVADSAVRYERNSAEALSM